MQRVAELLNVDSANATVFFRKRSRVGWSLLVSIVVAKEGRKRKKKSLTWTVHEENNQDSLLRKA